MQGVSRTLVNPPVRWLDVKDAATPSPRQPYVALDGDGQTRTGYLVRSRLHTSRWHATADNQWSEWSIGGPIVEIRSLLRAQARGCVTLHVEGTAPRDVQWRLDPNA